MKPTRCMLAAEAMTLATIFAVEAARASNNNSWVGGGTGDDAYLYSNTANWKGGTPPTTFFSINPAEDAFVNTVMDFGESVVTLSDAAYFNNGTDVFTLRGAGLTSPKWIFSDAANRKANVLVEEGSYTVNSEFTLAKTSGESAALTLTNGTIATGCDAFIGPGTGTLTIGDGGVFTCGTTAEKWIKIGNASSITVNEGGRIETYHITSTATEEHPASITLNGGTIVALTNGGTCQGYLLGNITQWDTSGADAYLSVAVTANGGTLDTQGHAIKLKTVAINGPGTLAITGGGTVTFETKPNCPVEVENGILIGNECVPDSLSFGKGGFISYDESSVTTSGTTETLASGVTISVSADDSVPEHVIVKNSGSVSWNVAYSGTTLTAISTDAKTATGGFTIWSGYYDGSASDQRQSWVSGYPEKTTKVIVPAGSTLKLYKESFECGEMVLCGDLTLYCDHNTNNRWRYLRPRSVTGDGTLYLGFHNPYGYLESQSANNFAAEVNVPVVALANYNPIMSGTSGYPLNFNDSFTIQENSTVALNSDKSQYEVNFKGDLWVDGTLELQSKVPELSKTIGGSGVINGNFTTAAGAKVCATVTSAEGETSYLTVNGAADLSNATVEIAGGKLLAGADYDDEIILLRATGAITWTKTSYVIPGQDKAWTIKTGTRTYNETDTEVTYNVLKAVKTQPRLILIVR